MSIFGHNGAATSVPRNQFSLPLFDSTSTAKGAPLYKKLTSPMTLASNPHARNVLSRIPIS